MSKLCSTMNFETAVKFLVTKVMHFQCEMVMVEKHVGMRLGLLPTLLQP